MLESILLSVCVGGIYAVLVKVLDSGSKQASTKSNYAITFTFGLISLGKIWINTIILLAMVFFFSRLYLLFPFFPIWAFMSPPMTSVIFWPFDPAKNAIPRWCTGTRWHILMAVMRGNRVGGNWLIKWDELKKFQWYTHRLMHRKKVTSELHDSYFRLMTIKHSISKIEWASDDYIIQSSSTSQLSCL